MHRVIAPLFLCSSLFLVGCGGGGDTAPVADDSEVNEYLNNLPDEDVGSPDDNVDVE